MFVCPSNSYGSSTFRIQRFADLATRLFISYARTENEYYMLAVSIVSVFRSVLCATSKHVSMLRLGRVAGLLFISGPGLGFQISVS